MSYVSKAGGDATNLALQDAYSNAEVLNVAPGGAGIIEGEGGNGFADGVATSTVDQDLDQYADGGNGGDDNVQADTNIYIRR